jgi:hypothetical protein
VDVSERDAVKALEGMTPALSPEYADLFSILARFPSRLGLQMTTKVCLVPLDINDDLGLPLRSDGGLKDILIT